MLIFDHVPPRRLEDVRFSEAGTFALQDQHSSESSMHAYGHLALVEIVDAFGFSSSEDMSDEDIASIKEVRAHVHHLASELLQGQTTTINGSYGGFDFPSSLSASIHEFSRGLGTYQPPLPSRYTKEKLWPLIDKVAKAKETTGVAA